MIDTTAIFVESLILMVALYIQWGIESQYSIAKEIFAILFIWAFFGNFT